MYIHRVVLENIRGFIDLDLSFDREQSDESYAGWSVITGDNASGKTTLLKAIALGLLGPEIARALQPTFNGWLREDAAVGRIAIEVISSEADTFAKGGARPKGTFFAELELTRKGSDVTISPGKKFLRKQRSAINGPWNLEQAVWFSAAYGPFRRLYGSSPEATRLMSGAGKPPRYATLFKEDATLGEAQIWLQELRFKTLEDHAPSRLLLQGVISLLNSEFLRNGLRVERVDSEGLWLRSEQGVVLPLAEMSDGYRSSLALLMDIVRHIALAYGPSGLFNTSNDVVSLPHRGVVLIDEVDAHLHPEWQRVIGFWLKKHFPNIQFIVTSHSAFVCQAADVNGLFTLPSIASEEVPRRLDRLEWERVIAGTPDSILRSEAFRLDYTRSPRAVKARAELGRLKAKAMSESLDASEKQKLEQLQLFASDEA